MEWLRRFIRRAWNSSCRIEKIPFLRKPRIRAFYKEKQLEKRYEPDLVVRDGIIVELKAVKILLPEHKAQLLNYMRITKTAVGYLVNFAPLDKVEWIRFVI
ncbi:MAG: GxxExxY protein [Fuerstiella sp.]